MQYVPSFIIKSIDNLKILVSAFNNLCLLFLTSSFNLSISFISCIADNLNFILSSQLFNFLKYLFLSAPYSKPNPIFFLIHRLFHHLVHTNLFLFLFLFHLFLVL